MKIAIILPSLLGGGAERLHILLANMWTKQGHNVHFIFLNNKGEIKELKKLISNQITIHYLNVFKLRQSIFPLRKTILREKFDVMLSAMWPLTVFSILSNMFTFSRNKIVVSDHTNLSRSRRIELKIPLIIIRATLFLFYRLAHGVVCVSDGVRQDISKLGLIPKKNIRVIYNPVAATGYSSKHYSLKEQSKIWPSYKKYKILSVGSLKEQKNFHNLILAYNELPNKIKDQSMLMILGEGDLRKELEQLIINHNLENNIFLAGFKVDPSPWYDTADLFVLSSSWEGFGNVLVEAMQARLPIVSTNCDSGPSEILQDGKFGILVPINDHKALANGILQALQSHPDLDSIYLRSQEFTVEKASEEYLNFFAKLIE